MLRPSVWLSLLLMSCAANTQDRPTFGGVETQYWLVQEADTGGRDDLLPAFAQSAHSYGCSTSQIGDQSSLNIYGERRSYYGISAACDEGALALIAMKGGRMRIGCAKPTTAQACERLLRNISQARD